MSFQVSPGFVDADQGHQIHNHLDVSQEPQIQHARKQTHPLPQVSPSSADVTTLLLLVQVRNLAIILDFPLCIASCIQPVASPVGYCSSPSTPLSLHCLAPVQSPSPPICYLLQPPAFPCLSLAVLQYPSNVHIEFSHTRAHTSV